MKEATVDFSPLAGFLPRWYLIGSLSSCVLFCMFSAAAASRERLLNASVLIFSASQLNALGDFSGSTFAILCCSAGVNSSKGTVPSQAALARAISGLPPRLLLAPAPLPGRPAGAPVSPSPPALVS